MDSNLDVQQAEVEFWDGVYSEPTTIDLEKIVSNPVFYAAEQFFGEVKGKRLLDFGCGAGEATVYFALKGAEVTAIDTSPEGIRALQNAAQKLGVSTIDARVGFAQDLRGDDQFDFVFGQMILHHLEPFDEIPHLLEDLMRKGAKAYFRENSANNRVLMFFRNHVVGKFGIPKLGDSSESPLPMSKVDQFRKHFEVQIEYPEMMLWHLVSIYLLKRRALGLTHALDQFTARVFPFMRKYSYNQRIKLTKRS